MLDIRISNVSAFGVVVVFNLFGFLPWFLNDISSFFFTTRVLIGTTLLGSVAFYVLP